MWKSSSSKGKIICASEIERHTFSRHHSNVTFSRLDSPLQVCQPKIIDRIKGSFGICKHEMRERGMRSISDMEVIDLGLELTSEDGPLISQSNLKFYHGHTAKNSPILMMLNLYCRPMMFR